MSEVLVESSRVGGVAFEYTGVGVGEEGTKSRIITTGRQADSEHQPLPFLLHFSLANVSTS